MAEDLRLYELINPSDQITFRASPLHAAIIADLMSSSLYFVKDVETGKAPADPDDIQSAYNAIWQDADALKAYSDAYASFLVGSARDRALFEEIVAGMTPEERKARRDQWHDERCSSMNDICRQCWEAAAKIAAYKPEVPTDG